LPSHSPTLLQHLDLTIEYNKLIENPYYRYAFH